jgi:tetratricopeptide (TPR) repeat protein
VPREGLGREPPSSRVLALGVAAAAALATWLTYLPALGNGFVNWDDDIYVYDNPHVRSLDRASLRWAFTTFDASNWHPLTWVSHQLDVRLWGLDPTGHHLTSVTLHAVNALLVVLLATRILRAAVQASGRLAGPGGDSAVLVAAGVTGALFGLHPLHVESAAWVSERKDLLCALFFLSSLLAYARHAAPVPGAPDGARPARIGRSYLASLALFALALLSKPMAVSLPAVLLLLDWYPFRRLDSRAARPRALLEKLPFLVLAIASSAVTVAAQRAGGALVSVESVPLWARIASAARSILAYLGKMVAPVDLLPFYPFTRGARPSAADLVAIGMVAGASALCAWLARRQRLWLAAWGWFVVTLAPVLGIVQAGGQSMADRYTYLPSLGPFLVAGLGAGAAVAGRWPARAPWLRPAAAALLALWLAALGYLTVRQIGIWRDSLTLWSAVIRADPTGAPLAYYNRGQAFMQAGQPARAAEDYATAGRLNPRYREAFFNRGVALEAMGRLDEAREEYERALRIDPANHQALNNLGVLYGRSGSPERALELLTRAVAAAPSYASAYYNRGLTYALLGREPEAAADFRRACELGFAQACAAAR